MRSPKAVGEGQEMRDMTGSVLRREAPVKTIIETKGQIFNKQTTETEYPDWLCAALLSLETGFPFKSSCHLLVNYTMNLPRVINTSYYCQGHMSTFRQTGWEGEMPEAYEKQATKLQAAYCEERPLPF